MKGKSAKPKGRGLTDWEWTVIVGAWRYYEYRETISSSMFPYELWGHCFNGDRYDEKAKQRIAHQFANVDHYRGEKDWESLPDCDRKPWSVFYAYCKAFCEGFTRLELRKETGETEVRKGFYCETTRKWHDALNPRHDMYFREECIVKATEPWREE